MLGVGLLSYLFYCARAATSATFIALDELNAGNEVYQEFSKMELEKKTNFLGKKILKDV